MFEKPSSLAVQKWLHLMEVKALWDEDSDSSGGINLNGGVLATGPFLNGVGYGGCPKGNDGHLVLTPQ
jgi:hypothetical protein